MHRHRSRRSLITLAILLPTIAAWQIPDWPSFVPAVPPLLLPEVFANALFNLSSSRTPDDSDTSDLRLQRRQNANACPQDFNACTNLGAPGLCCAPQAVCSADAIGQVACCPSGYACSGTIAGIITAGTVNGQGALVGGSATTAGVATTGLQLAGGSTTSFVQASQTSATTGATTGTGSLVQTDGGQFILDGTSTVATPGAAVRGAEIPLIIRGVIRLLEMVPL